MDSLALTNVRPVAVTSESVSEGHADKVCDFIADAIVDAYLAHDAGSRARFFEGFDFRPGQIARELDLLRPIYRSTTNYGHFGRPCLPWESNRGTDRVGSALREGGR